MENRELIAYLKTWAKLHTQEVYGSPRDYISVWALESELDSLLRNSERD